MGLPIDTMKARLKDKNGPYIYWSNISAFSMCLFLRLGLQRNFWKVSGLQINRLRSGFRTLAH
ncbi:hypothetical protein Gotur_008003 [Gossypium turneri]